jgi:hypothetical protein
LAGDDPVEASRQGWWAGVEDLFGRHFWRLYLLFVTALVGLIVFGLVTGSNGPLWVAAVVAGVTGGTAVSQRVRRRDR